MTTWTPRLLAAESFAAVIGPPLSFVTSRSIRCSRMSADSLSTVYGPRPRKRPEFPPRPGRLAGRAGVGQDGAARIQLNPRPRLPTSERYRP
jgi:hypothetical protein